MSGQTIVVSVLADTKQFAQGMGTASDSASGWGSTVGKIATVAVAALATAAVAVAGFVGLSIKAAAESEKIAAQTNAVLESTENAAGRTLAQLGKYATQLSRLSGVDDEVIASGQNLLLTFTNIQGLNFDKATEAALNMSVALGQDMASASRVVGKALNDPVAGLSALTRVGVQFSESQKKVIADLVASGDIAGAQAIILEQLAVKFGGSAEAYGNTFLGVKDRIKNATEGIQEIIGGALLPVLTGVGAKVATLLESIADNPAFLSFVDGVSKWVLSLLDGQSAVGGLLEQLLPLLSFFSPLGLIIKALTPVLPILGAGLAEIGKTVAAALLPILPQLAGLLQSIVTVISGGLATVLPALIPVILAVANAFGGTLAALLPALLTIVTALVPVISQLAEFIGRVAVAFGPVIEQVATLVGQLLEAFLPLLIAILPPILQLVGVLLDLLLPALEQNIGIITAIVTAIIGFISWIVELATTSASFTEFLTKLGTGILDFFGAIPGKVGAIFAGAGAWLVDAGRNIIQGLLNGATGLLKNIGKFFLDVVPAFIREPFKAALGIRSPSTVFAGFGKNIIAGLEAGLAGPNNIDALMSSLSGQVSGSFGVELSAPGGYRAGLGGNTYEITVMAVAPNAEVGRAVVEAIDEFERFGGKR